MKIFVKCMFIYKHMQHTVYNILLKLSFCKQLNIELFCNRRLRKKWMRDNVGKMRKNKKCNRKRTGNACNGCGGDRSVLPIKHEVVGDTAASRQPSSRFCCSDFASKNSPPDCFLYDAHPLRVQIPIIFCKKITSTFYSTRYHGTPKGIRTPGLSVRSRTLYPLSYGCISFKFTVI